MDICEVEPPGVTALQKAAQAQIEDKPRPPLVPSEKNNAIPSTRKLRDVASRYKDGIAITSVSRPSTPARCPSPNATRTSPALGMSLPKRTQSAERRRPVTPSPRFSAPSSPSRPSTPSSPARPSTPSSPSRSSTPSSLSSRSVTPRSTTPVRDAVTGMHSTTGHLFSNKTPDGLWPSMRSLSSSFKSESLTVSINKREKLVVNSSSDKTIKSPTSVVPERKRTPLRGRNTSDQSDNSKPLGNLNSRVIDQHRWPGILNRRLSTNVLPRSVDLSDKVGRSASSTAASRGVSPKRTNSSSDSVTSAPQLSLSEVAERLLHGGGRVEKGMKSVVNSSSQPSERSLSITQPSRTQSLPIPSLSRPSSPISGLCRPSSPNKVFSTSSSMTRGMSSPSRTRPSTPFSLSSNPTSRAGGISSVLKYGVDVRKGKNTHHLEDAHQLKLLYNANLQWRFVNAQADKTLSIQKMRTENALYNVSNSISKLRDSVIMRRMNVQHLQQEMKLDMILREQMAYLEHYVALEREHYSSLSGTVEALNASTLRLPVAGGARADVVDVKNALSSAVDVMQAMGSSICYLLSKVEGTQPLASELSAITAKEKFMLDECRELLASISALQVQESSLITHIIQLRQDAPKLH